MDLAVFNQTLSNPATLIPQLVAERKAYFQAKAYQEFDPKKHKVHSLLHRPKKQIWVPDPSGALDDKGRPERIMKWQDVNRISIPIQKLLTSRATAFTTAGELHFQSKPQTAADKKLMQYLTDTFRKNKMQFRNADIVRALYSETEVAEIWHADENGELRCTIRKPSDGYDLIPVYDGHQNLIAFAVQYNSIENGKIIRRMDLYTDKELRRLEQVQGGQWQLTKSDNEKVPNPYPLPYGKIPVIYYWMPQSIWADVQPMIDRLEYLLSNFGDTNDYNGSPILFAEGEIDGWSAKGETGKVLVGKAGAKVSYITWDKAPDSIKLEIETLVDMIFTNSQVPNISFKEMRGLGDVSGVAFDRMMMDAHLKAKDMQNGIYGEGVQRRCNLLKAMLASVYPDLDKAKELEITPVFELFRIDDKAARVELAMKANGGKPIVGWLDSITFGGLSSDPEATYNELQQEVQEKQNQPQQE
jgi:SPP1 family phage portal protein